MIDGDLMWLTNEKELVMFIWMAKSLFNLYNCKRLLPVLTRGDADYLIMNFTRGGNDMEHGIEALNFSSAWVVQRSVYQYETRRIDHEFSF